MSAAEPLVPGERRYTTVAIVLHWAIAAAMIFQVGLGLRMGGLHGTARFAVFQLHKSIGITILVLVALRLLWRLTHRPPALATRGWERGLAHAAHWLFYILLFALPISGWLIVSTSRIVIPTLLYGTIPLPHLPGFAAMGAAARAAWNDAGVFAHGSLVYVLYVLFALHVAGALKHHFIGRDAEIDRMAPGVQPGKWFDPRLIAIFGLGVILAALALNWGPKTAPASAAPQVVETNTVAAAPEAPATAPNADNATAVANASDAAATRDKTGAMANWAIDKGSTLKFHTIFSGDAIDGGFNSFTGTIAFGADALDTSHVDIRIPTASIFSGDAQRDETLKSSDWFSTAAFGTATFKASRFRKTGANRYVASGSLTIKGVTLPMTLPFTLDITGDKAVMRGTATVDRTAYQIGQGDYAKTDEIPAAVSVAVSVRATRQP